MEGGYHYSVLQVGGMDAQGRQTGSAPYQVTPCRQWCSYESGIPVLGVSPTSK